MKKKKELDYLIKFPNLSYLDHVSIIYYLWYPLITNMIISYQDRYLDTPCTMLHSSLILYNVDEFVPNSFWYLNNLSF